MNGRMLRRFKSEHRLSGSCNHGNSFFTVEDISKADVRALIKVLDGRMLISSSLHCFTLSAWFASGAVVKTKLLFVLAFCASW